MTTERGSDAPRTPSRGLLWTVVLLMLLASVLLWAASSAGWLEQRYRTLIGREDVTNIDGAQVLPELVPIALAALAAIAAVLATAGWLRRAVGLLVVLAGGVLGWRVVGDLALTELARKRVPQGATPVGSPDFSPTGLVLVSAATALLLIAGVLVLFLAARMPGMGAKYAAPGAAKERVKDPDRQMWDDLDEGRDPTEGEHRAGGDGD